MSHPIVILSSFSQPTRSPMKLPTVSTSCVFGVVEIHVTSPYYFLESFWRYPQHQTPRRLPLKVLPLIAPQSNQQMSRRARWVNCALIFVFTSHDKVFCDSSILYKNLTSRPIVVLLLSFSQPTRSPTKLPTVSSSCVSGVIQNSPCALAC